MFQGIKSEWSYAAQCPSCHFLHGTIFCVRLLVGATGAACFPPLRFLPHTAPRWTHHCQTQQHALCTATSCMFGASSTFWWNVSVEKKFGLLQCANLQVWCAPPSFSLALPSFVLVPQQMAAVYFVKWFVKMDRKVTSNIKFKNYKIVNKRSTNSIIIFNAWICFE